MVMLLYVLMPGHFLPPSSISTSFPPPGEKPLVSVVVKDLEIPWVLDWQYYFY